jgi:hypothetical protein
VYQERENEMGFIGSIIITMVVVSIVILLINFVEKHIVSPFSTFLEKDTMDIYSKEKE